MGVPDDPTTFIAAAERGINERDLDATAGVYAPDARLESFTDGAHEQYRGADQVRTAWKGYLAAMDDRGFTLSKKLTAVSDDTIVNDWTGTLGGRTEAHGIESWRFDDSGKVAEHQMYTFLNVKPSTSPLQRLRLSLDYPLTALAFLREQRKARKAG
jgi:hypothetical protein